MSKIKITLVEKDKSEVVIEVNQETVAEASVLCWQGKFFMYSGMQAELAYRPKFLQVNAPVYLV